ncbi:hypothetical protein BEN30_03750 [Magnetovibrio blakemorei]|uniref:Solute-binding protein family 3/N-terminal domain-containing protein n=2 Tax=Magnetovibrio blakemorei TaxID=28181 RepID=A0A1E5QBP3_9PROT|nr:hypothetical protein BEN30_03750 [Magnetovibrio blakemorei]
MSRLGCFAVIVCLFWGTVANAEPLRVVYPAEAGRDTANAYPVQLLELALRKSGKPYEMQPFQESMNEARARSILEAGDGNLTVAWFGTSRDFEQRLRPVRIPMYRGLLGHRIFLINKAKQPLFSAVKTVADLHPLLALQGQGWSDVEILAGAGLNVDTARYNNLFPMLNGGRGDYFPRGVTEAFAELEHFGLNNPNLAVEEELTLVYPFAMFYFVSRSDVALHDAIRDGLAAAFADGSFQALFESHPAIAGALKKVRLNQRRKLTIDNLLMTPETRAIPAEYWYDGGQAGTK